MIKVFEDVLGYDALSEISRETQVKGKYIDIALKIAGVVKVIVEAKAAAVTLRERHIEQAEQYASKNNFEWVLLTNGVVWNLYHLTFDEGIESVLAFSADLSSDENFDGSAKCLGILHRQSIKKGELDQFWEQKTALSPASIGRALFQEDVIRVIRREIRRGEGILADPEDLAEALRRMLSSEAREAMGPLKVKKRRSKRPRTTPITPAAEGSNEASPPGPPEPDEEGQ
ncbi:MAG: type I restriction enzyme HsdR N-terminal domain-containing protein [Deltaproteobacteria bacterium]|nr:type I restriction enzyme HsdR N-terminal domain-containing protein [Deltaproteobacteria bacterium]